MNGTVNGTARLQEQRQRLKGLVDTVRPLAPGQVWVTSADGEAPCGTPTAGGWPRTWDYGIRLVQGTEPGVAQRVVAAFRGDGWSFTTASAGGPVTRLAGRREGVLLVVAFGPDGTSVDVSASGPCVQEDGDLRP